MNRQQITGVRELVVTHGPDGEHVILPVGQWYDAPMDDREDFTAWELEHYELGPKASAASYPVGPAADCSECVKPKHGVRVYCVLHRCRALKSSGKPCKLAASERHGGLYCSQHACYHRLAPGILCAERMVGVTYRCAVHQESGPAR